MTNNQADALKPCPDLGQRFVSKIIEIAQNSTIGLGDAEKSISLTLYEQPYTWETIALVLVSAYTAKYDLVSLMAAAMEHTWNTRAPEPEGEPKCIRCGKPKREHAHRREHIWCSLDAINLDEYTPPLSQPKAAPTAQPEAEPTGERVITLKRRCGELERTLSEWLKPCFCTAKSTCLMCETRAVLAKPTAGSGEGEAVSRQWTYQQIPTQNSWWIHEGERTVVALTDFPGVIVSEHNRAITAATSAAEQALREARNQVMLAEAARDIAVKESNRCDQKWMDGLDEIFGKNDWNAGLSEPTPRTPARKWEALKRELAAAEQAKAQAEQERDEHKATAEFNASLLKVAVDLRKQAEQRARAAASAIRAKLSGLPYSLRQVEFELDQLTQEAKA